MIGFAELMAFAIALVLAVEFGRIAKSRGQVAWPWGGFVFVSVMVATALASRSDQIWSYTVAVMVIVACAAVCTFRVVRRPILAEWQDIEIPKVITFGLVTIPRLILGTLILVGIAINFANVIGRYVFQAPIIWAEEIMIYIMIWAVLTGAVLVAWDGGHLKMDFFTLTLPSPWKEILNFVGATIFLLVCVFVLPQSLRVVELMTRFDQRSVIARIPMAIPHSAILLGFFLMLVAVAIRFRMYVTGQTKKLSDESAGNMNDGAPGERP
jgi:TRAP-type C4-dicarboxylate transport system permease small subunit